MTKKLTPWAWAVCDPNRRLRNSDGDRVDRLICWDFEQAQHLLEDAVDAGSPEDEYKAGIEELFPLFAQPEAVTDTANYWREHARKDDPWPTKFFNLEQAYNHATNAYWAYKGKLARTMLILQRYQPPGSPIPGEEFVLAGWILAEMDKRPVQISTLRVGDKFVMVNMTGKDVQVLRRTSNDTAIFTAEHGHTELGCGLDTWVLRVTEESHGEQNPDQEVVG